MTRALILGLLLGGCAYTSGTTAVAPLGADTYSVGASAGQYVGGSAEARTLALQKADAHCGQQGRSLKVIAIEPAGIRANVTFMCLAAGDARLQQPMGGQTLNVNVNAGQ